ncbi:MULTISPECIES: DUF2796 domain-containing protein [Oceanisphaera]|uniref:DUF2796 domain-containing protein n=1 Tax=Oceanisphaera ostreae TaxID=914151 RepID=A0ABW3KKZ7_9GAMM
MSVKPLLFILPLLPLTAQALPGVHQHGFGRLSLAQDQQQLMLELFAPAADIVGFEHAPNNAEQHTQYREALARIQNADLLFTLPRAAGCQLIASQLIEQDEDTLNEAEHEHDGEHHHDEHEHEHEHDDDHHADHGHSDILVQYRYQCQQPQALTQLSTQLFEQFTSFNNIELQGIVATGQIAATLTSEKPTASW